MNKCIIIPDSFKGTLSAITICDIIKKKVMEYYPECEVIAIPAADGGEGTVECFLYAMGGEKVTVDTTGPYGNPLEASYAKCGKKAIIEIASVAGLALAEKHLNPCLTTTYGLGKLMIDAMDKGCEEIVLGLGGSCTNDGGVGVARSLGTKFYNQEGKQLIPASNEFCQIVKIDNSGTQKKVQNIKITAICDINNPMYGKKGAAYIFAPQKGAKDDMVRELDTNLRYLSKKIEMCMGKSVAGIPGAGAAGALGAGVVAFLGGELKPGIEVVLDLINFDKLLKGTDMVFTGEGKIDSQSMGGKVVIGVARHAKKYNVPVTAVVGSVGAGASEAYNEGVTSIFSINRKAEDFSVSRYSSAENLRATIDSLLRFSKSVK